jgi:DNA-binding NtrC family response regulator
MASERVLLVDDEVDFVAALAERLRARGLEVETASSGPEALERAGHGTFDAVVLDLAMPGMDGLETMRLLLADHPDLQVMLLTGQGTVRTAAEATRLGAVDVFEKPTDVETLAARIRAARAERLTRKDQRAQAGIEEILRARGW